MDGLDVGLGVGLGGGLMDGLDVGLGVGLAEAVGAGPGGVASTVVVSSLTVTLKWARILCTAPWCLVTTAEIPCTPSASAVASMATAISCFPPTRSQGGR